MGINNLSTICAFETPFKNLDYASMFGDYIFALAHLVETNADYMNWVINRAEDMELYLDNGAYELGSSMDVRNYIHVIESLQPTVAVVPDAMQDIKKTIQLAQNFFDLGPPKGIQYMVVPQGRTTDEWILCLHKLVRMFRHEFHIIGIPRVMYPRRLQLSRHAQSFTKKAIHLLGCVEPSEIAGVLHSNVLVKSLDTSWPARHALKKVGPKDRIDFENDDIIFEDFQASVAYFLNIISPMKPLETELAEVVVSGKNSELDDEKDLDNQFAPPKNKDIRVMPLPKIDDEDDDDD